MVGKILGHYEILEPLGAGGMGEVYRARDTKLDRDVAIKLLPRDVADDRERLARLEREAKLLASLSHTNIATIHGLEEHEGARFIVLELVKGRSLEEWLRAGALPVDRALDVCEQIADALEAAHGAGVIHRDLKPANVVISPEGKAKVLDFGIAKSLAPAKHGMEPGTLKSTALTVAGTLIGTAPYMSPEQVRGEDVDTRADIWAFGCLTFEVLTGTQAFARDTVADTLAAIIEVEPAFDRIPPVVPSAVRRLLRRCLKKDPHDRLRDIGDARIELADARRGEGSEPDVAGPVVGRASSFGRRGGLPWIAGIAVGIAIGAAASNLWHGAATPGVLASLGPPARFAIPLPPGQRLTGTGGRVVDISPDGRYIAYVANRQVYVRDLDSLEVRMIPDTQIGGALGTRDIFFSHGGDWIGFSAGGALMKASVSGGGSTTTLWSIDGRPWRPHWTAEDYIYFGRREQGVWRGPAAGGDTEPVITVADGERAFGPQLLPDGEWILYTVLPTGATSMAAARVVAESPITHERVVLIDGREGRYVPTGHILYAVGEALLAAPFDLATHAVTGVGHRVVESVFSLSGTTRSQYSISDTGTLVFLPGTSIPSTRRLVWVNRSGQEQDVGAPLRAYSSPHVSPDGDRILVAVADAGGGNEGHAYWDGHVLTPLPFEGRSSTTWAHDGSRIVVAAERPDGSRAVYTTPIDGSTAVEPLLTTSGFTLPMVSTPDGGLIYVERARPGEGNMDIRMFRRGEATPRELLATEDYEGRPALSPDGNWLAYQSDRSGSTEIWMASVADPAGFQRRISTDGGAEPQWSPDGDELYYVHPDEGLMMALPFDNDNVRFGAAEPLFSVDEYDMALFNARNYDVAPDGRFIFLRPADSIDDPGTSRPHFVVVVNWFEELKRLVPAGR